jgi:enoyl-CoA hydratase
LIERLRVPVIAAIDGHCIGGGFELALACDVRVASRSAYFVGAAVNVGLVASVFRLPRVVGGGRANAMLLTGERIDAETALYYGIVTEVHQDRALSPALQIAERIASRAPLSVEASKRLLSVAFDLSREEFKTLFDDTVELLANSEDHREALRAFSAREKPVFNRR